MSATDRIHLHPAVIAICIAMTGAAQLHAAGPVVAGSAATLAAPAACVTARATTLARGEAARSRIAALRSEHEQAFRRAERWLRQNGYEPTSAAYSSRSQLVHLAEGFRPSCTAGAEPSDAATGTLSLWSWDDGDDSTWEGILHVEEDETGASALFAVQIRFDDQGMSFERTAVFDISGPDRPGNFTLPELTPDFGGCSVDFDSENFYKTSALSCTGIAGGCLLSGPGAPECFAVACTGAMLTSFLLNLSFWCL